MARRIFFKEQSNLGVAPNGYSIMGFNTSNRAIKTDESGVVKLIESVYTDETNTIVIGASGGTGSVSVNGYYELPNYAPMSGQVLGLSGSSLHWITSGGGLSGAGTTNYLAKWNSGGLTGSLVYDNGTSIGINKNSLLGGLLDIKGTDTNTNSVSLLISNSNGDTILKARNDQTIDIGNNTVYRLSYYGELIVGNATWAGRLTLNNSTNTQFFAIHNGTGAGSNTLFDSGDTFFRSLAGTTHIFKEGSTGNVSIGTNFTSPTSRLHVKSNNVSSDYALKVDNFSGTALLHIVNNGAVSFGAAVGSNYFSIKDTLTPDSNRKVFSVTDSLGDERFYIKRSDIYMTSASFFYYGSTLDFNFQYTASGSKIKFKNTGYGANSLEIDVTVTPIFTNPLNNTLYFDVSNIMYKDRSIMFGLSPGIGPSADGTWRILTPNTTQANATFEIQRYDDYTNPQTKFKIKTNGTINLPALQVGNSGLSSGDLYKDTAANILANGDYVIGMKA